MPVFEYESIVSAAPAEVFAWHERPGAFTRLTPPWQRVKVVSWEGGIRDGARLVMRIGRPPFAVTWEARHKDYAPGLGFTDVMERGPFSKWEHQHRFLPAPENRTRVHDRVEFEAPLSALDRPLLNLLRRMFTHRHLRIRRDLERLSPLRARLPMKIVIAGASGLIGSELSAFLDAGGFDVHTLVRRRARPDRKEIEWDPQKGALPAEPLEGAAAVIILSGAGVTERRWTESRKREIIASRTTTTRLVAETLARLKAPPVLISASAIGYYGDCGETEVTENAPAGQGFLAGVCEEWEDSTRPAAEAGVRVVRARIGVVVSARGGALAQMLPLFRIGLGGHPGPGGNFVSWISIDDVLGALLHLIVNPGLTGPVNLTAKGPVTGADFGRALGKVMNRPARLCYPAGLIRLFAGEMGEAVLLEGARVRPERLLASGFRFMHNELEDALRDELGAWRRQEEEGS